MTLEWSHVVVSFKRTSNSETVMDSIDNWNYLIVHLRADSIHSPDDLIQFVSMDDGLRMAIDMKYYHLML